MTRLGAAVLALTASLTACTSSSAPGPTSAAPPTSTSGPTSAAPPTSAARPTSAGVDDSATTHASVEHVGCPVTAAQVSAALDTDLIDVPIPTAAPGGDGAICAFTGLVQQDTSIITISVGSFPAPRLEATLPAQLARVRALRGNVDLTIRVEPDWGDSAFLDVVPAQGVGRLYTPRWFGVVEISTATGPKPSVAVLLSDTEAVGDLLA